MVAARHEARAALVGSAVCFGLMAVVARRLTQAGFGFTPGHLSVIRFGVGLCACLVAFRFRPGLHGPSRYGLLVGRGLSGGLVVILYFSALARIPAGQAGIIYNLFPVIATAMSLGVFRERPTVHLLLATLLAFFGVALVLGQGSFAFRPGWGEAAALGAAFFAATSAVIIRAARASHNAITIFFYFNLAGMPVVAPFALGPWPRHAGPWILAVFMGFAALGGQLLMSQAYGALSVSEASVWLQLLPISTYLLAVPLLGERLTGFGLAGVALTVAGVVYGTAKGHKPSRSAG